MSKGARSFLTDSKLFLDQPPLRLSSASEPGADSVSALMNTWRPPFEPDEGRHEARSLARALRGNVVEKSQHSRNQSEPEGTHALHVEEERDRHRCTRGFRG